MRRGRLPAAGRLPPDRRRAGLLAALAVGLVLATPAAPALAATPPGGDVPRDVEAALGGEVTPTGTGLYRVKTGDGIRLTTHGPDFRDEIIYPKAGHGTGLGPGDPERAPVCAADAASDRYQEVLYGYWDPAGADPGENRLAEVREPIRAAVRRMNAVLSSESVASGGAAADYIVRCEAGGEVRVSAFGVATTSGTDRATFSQVVDAAEAAGFTDRLADYTIFYAGDGPAGTCGTGSYYANDSPSALNPNNNPGGATEGGYGVSFNGCWYGSVPMHENGHNQGAVQRYAPYSTGTGAHCYDENDVMCYSPDGGDANQGGTINRCTDYLHFDCGWDTYFDAAPEPGEWLETHWNLGSSANRFIAFGTPGQNTSPSAAFDFACTDLACEFTDASEDQDGTVASRSWDFGDGATSTAADPAHEFAAAGTYDVELTVTDDDGDATSLTRELSVPVAPPPPNDPFAAAQVLGGASASAGGGNDGATKEPGEPDHALDPGGDGGASVWYRWTAPASGTAVVGTCGSDFDTLLAVYEAGAEITTLPRIGSSDDTLRSGCFRQSEVAFTAAGGTAYAIAVDGYDRTDTGANDPETGNIELALALSSPPSAPAEPPAQPGGGQAPVTPVDGEGDGGVDAEPVEFASKRLRRGTALTETAGPPGSMHRYSLKLPRRARKLRVALDGPAGSDLDLYLGDGRNPATARRGCSPGEPDADEACRVRRPKRKRWFAAVENIDASAGARFTIRATYRRPRT